MADNLDPETLRELNEAMREMRETVSQMVPAVMLMTAAMTKAAVATTGETASTKDATKIVDDYVKSVAEATLAEKQKIEQDKKDAALKQVLNDYQKTTTETLGKFQTALFSTTTGMSKYSAAASGLTASINSTLAAMSAFAPKMISMGSKMGSSLKGIWNDPDPMGSLKNTVKSFTALITPVNVVTTLMKGLTRGLTLLVSIVGTAVESVFKQNDAYLKAADDLATFGGTGALTATEIGKLGRAAGYSKENLDSFVKVTKSLGSDIIGLSSTVSGGIKVFGQMIAMDEETLRTYRALGFTQEQLNQTQADYIKLQVRAGIQITDQMKRDGAMRKASLDYTDNLLVLSSLSGMEIEDIKKKQEMARADISFQTAVAMKSKEMAELEEKANQTNNLALKAEYKQRRETLEAEIENMKGLQDMGIVAKMSAQDLAGFSQLIATGGKSVTELSSKFVRMTDSSGTSIAQFVQEVMAGKKDFRGILKSIAESTDKDLDMVGKSQIAIRDEMTSTYATAGNYIELAAKLRGKSEKEISIIIQKEIEQRKRAARDDPLQALRGEQETLERRLRLVADSMLDMISGPINTGFKTLIEITDHLAEALASGVDYINNFFGKKTDFASMFKTPEQLKQNLDKVNKEVEKLESQLNKEVNARMEYLTLEAQYDQKQKELKEARDKGRNEEAKKLEKEFSAIGVALMNAKAKISTPGVVFDREQALKGSRAEQDIRENLRGKLGEKAQAQSSYETRLKQKGVKSEGQLSQENKSTNESGAETGRLGTRGLGAGLSFDKIFKFSGNSGSRESFEQLDAGFKSKLTSAAEEYFKTTGKPLQINSATRSFDDQQRLYQETVNAGRPGIGPGGAPVAKPDPNNPSKHILGMAADIQQYTDPIAVKILNSYGLVNTKVKDDPQHFEQARYGGIFSGPSSGYPVMMHGDEVILPLPDASKINKEELPAAISRSVGAPISTDTNADNTNTLVTAMIDVLTTKLDKVIDKLETSNNIQDDLLKYSMV